MSEKNRKQAKRRRNRTPAVAVGTQTKELVSAKSQSGVSHLVARNVYRGNWGQGLNRAGRRKQKHGI